ncbi:hypothetical protein CVT26_013919 [Gymnopilus dilepis]|uniref:Uncharacterized protein n=1 Tax=Gymnopilus dilepis TaxID=231916 RepID=A0A409VW30_9AGAR|nr:hypothetical protein CVT26_013919 [Gymnopilus dilepis]
MSLLHRAAFYYLRQGRQKRRAIKFSLASLVCSTVSAVTGTLCDSNALKEISILFAVLGGLISLWLTLLENAENTHSDSSSLPNSISSQALVLSLSQTTSASHLLLCLARSLLHVHSHRRNADHQHPFAYLPDRAYDAQDLALEPYSYAYAQRATGASV